MHKPLFMRILFVWFALLVGPLSAFAQGTLSPDEMLKSEGTLALCDGNSYFVFSRDGTFHSFPLGLSGRQLDGTWTEKQTNACIFTVQAKLGWINGASTAEDYRRIVFVVYRGTAQVNAWPDYGAVKAPNYLWNGYFMIDELVKIPKPAG